MQLNSTLSKSAQFLLVLVCFILLIAIVDRIGTTYFVPWNVVWIFSGVFVGMVWISLWVRSAIPSLEVASEVDQRMQLDDRISSAIAAEKSDEPFSVAVVDDAIAIADCIHDFNKAFGKLLYFVIATRHSVFTQGFNHPVDQNIITIEEGALSGGFGSAVSSFLHDNQLNNKIYRFGINNIIYNILFH